MEKHDVGQSEVCDMRSRLRGDCAGGDCTGGGKYRLPQFSLRFLLFLMTLAAIWVSGIWWLSPGSLVVTAVVLLTFLFGCNRTRRAVLFIAPAMFCPFAWVLVMRDYPWSEYRQMWASFYFELPGIAMAAYMQRSSIGGELGMHVAATATACAMFLAFVSVGRVGLAWLVCAALASFIVCLVSSHLAYTLFAM